MTERTDEWLKYMKCEEQELTSRPPPRQEPLIAATIGMGDFSICSNIFWPSCERNVTSSAVLDAWIILRERCWWMWVFKTTWGTVCVFVYGTWCQLLRWSIRVCWRWERRSSPPNSPKSLSSPLSSLPASALTEYSPAHTINMNYKKSHNTQQICHS